MWWAVAFIAVGFAALATRSVVLSAGPHAAEAGDVAARELTRALTAATMTVVALVAFIVSLASTLTLTSMYLIYGNRWGDGTATAAQLFLLLAMGLEITAFVTPYWLIASDIETSLLAPA
jgi:hypothetical protein